MFGQRLRELRKQRGISQAHLAEAVSVRQTYISELERGGRTNPSREVIQRLAHVLGVSVTELAEAAWRDRAPLGEDVISEPEFLHLQALWQALTLNDRAILLRLATALVHESAVEHLTASPEDVPGNAT